VNVATVVPKGEKQAWHHADGSADHGAATHLRSPATADLQLHDLGNRDPRRRVDPLAPEDQSIDVNTQEYAGDGFVTCA
jgi:hypothetical protein